MTHVYGHLDAQGDFRAFGEGVPADSGDLVIYLDGKQPSAADGNGTEPMRLYGKSCDWPVNDDCFVIGNLPPTSYPAKSVMCLYGGARPYVKFHPAWAVEIKPAPNVTPSHEVRDAGERGKGLFATRDIAPGKHVVVERPIIVAATHFPRLSGGGEMDSELVAMLDELKIGQEEQEVHGRRVVRAPAHLRTDPDGLLDMAVDRLRPERKAALLGLKNSKPMHGGMTAVEAVVRTNFMQIDLPGTKWPHGGVTETISRANHSCVPNCEFTFNHLMFAYQLTALRPIKAGEEITVSYCGVMPLAERQEELFRKYHFHCTCLACTDPEVNAVFEKRINDESDVSRLQRDFFALKTRGMAAGEPLRALRKLARKVYGQIGKEGDQTATPGLERPSTWITQILKSWLLVEAIAETDMETAMELAVEGRRVAAFAGAGWSKEWKFFDAMVKSGCSRLGTARALVIKPWL